MEASMKVSLGAHACLVFHCSPALPWQSMQLQTLTATAIIFHIHIKHGWIQSLDTQPIDFIPGKKSIAPGYCPVTVLHIIHMDGMSEGLGMGQCTPAASEIHNVMDLWLHWWMFQDRERKDWTQVMAVVSWVQVTSLSCMLASSVEYQKALCAQTYIVLVDEMVWWQL